MKIVTALLATAMIANIALPAHAERPGNDWIPLDQAFRKITDAGYRDVTSIKADDERWEAKAWKDGAEIKLLVDPRSGAVSEKPKKPKRNRD